VIVEGIPGTAMPGSPALAPADVESLTDFVLHLATQPVQPSSTTPEQALLRDAGFVDIRGTAAPPLSLIDAANRTTTITELKGKFVLVHFWGTGCIHCLKELPQLKSLEAEFAEHGLVVLYVCTDADTAAEAQALADRHSPGLRILIDDTGLAMARFGVQALPATWLIDAEGHPIARSDGARDWNSPACRQVLEHWLPHR
jgi:thiol-disulfide isomerase/thioredoxin